ncbi:MAG TPA: hypothetical protein VGB77_12035 [Abditibacteriaceae bacterium]|jgi:hypothetical protein
MSELTDLQRWKELPKRPKQAKATLKATLKADEMRYLFAHTMRVMAKFGPHLHVSYSNELKEFSFHAAT